MMWMIRTHFCVRWEHKQIAKAEEMGEKEGDNKAAH